ncbi:MAG: sodium transporter, partial [Bacteroidota bacterium]
AGFTASRELTFVNGINDMLPMGIKGIMLTGLLGALASTIDTHLNWGSSYWSNDIYKHIISEKWRKRTPKSSELVWVARLSNLLILFIALTIMFNLGSIQEAWYIALVFEAGIGAVLLLRWLWERINLFSEISAIVASLVIAPIVLTFVSEQWLQLVIMAASTTIIVILVTLLTPKNDPKKLADFYQKVRPSGFWKTTAQQLGEDTKAPIKRMNFAIKNVIITAISLFTLLVGFGKLMFRPSTEGVVLSLVLIVIGLVTIPIWYKGIFKTMGDDVVG